MSLKLVFLILTALINFSSEYVLLNYTVEFPIKLSLISNFISMPNVNLLICLITLYIFFFLKSYRYNLLLIITYILLININFKFNFIYKNIFDEYFSNSLLSNSLNLIHPPLVIYVWSFIIMLSFLIIIASVRVIKKKLIIYKLIKASLINIKNCFFILNFTILLGFWWAQQLNTWQGWWAWDKSEVLILIIFWNFLSVLHLHLKKEDTILFLFNFICLSVVVYLYYVYEISFFTNLHTFFSNTTVSLNSFKFYNSIIILLLSSLLLIKKLKITLKYNIKNYTPPIIVILLLLSMELKTFLINSWTITIVLISITLILSFSIRKKNNSTLAFLLIKTIHNYFWFVLPIFLFNYFNFLNKTLVFTDTNNKLKVTSLRIQNHQIINNWITDFYKININFKFSNNIQISGIRFNFSNSFFFNNWNLKLNAKNLLEIQPTLDILLILLI